jgi:hypothetical protein
LPSPVYSAGTSSPPPPGPLSGSAGYTPDYSSGSPDHSPGRSPPSSDSARSETAARRRAGPALGASGWTGTSSPRRLRLGWLSLLGGSCPEVSAGTNRAEASSFLLPLTSLTLRRLLSGLGPSPPAALDDGAHLTGPPHGVVPSALPSSFDRTASPCGRTPHLFSLLPRSARSSPNSRGFWPPVTHGWAGAFVADGAA